MKDQLGHGSDGRGGSAPRTPSAHQLARRAIQQSPNAPPTWAHDALVAAGYRETDINRLRVAAGAVVADDGPAHQTGVRAIAKDLTVAPINFDRLKSLQDAVKAQKAATQ